MDCTSCMYEYMCDWTEAEASECSHYRPDLEHKEAQNDTKKQRGISRSPPLAKQFKKQISSRKESLGISKQ